MSFIADTSISNRSVSGRCKYSPHLLIMSESVYNCKGIRYHSDANTSDYTDISKQYIKCASINKNTSACGYRYSLYK